MKIIKWGIYISKSALLTTQWVFKGAPKRIWMEIWRYWSFLLPACQKKSYLICDKITNFRIFKQPIPNLFQSTKLRQPKQGRDSCLILHNISEICNFVTNQITFFMTCQQHLWPEMVISGWKVWWRHKVMKIKVVGT